MLTRVDVLSESPFYLNIRDARPTDSVIVEKIEGLDPPDVDLYLGSYARDGGFYSGRRVAQRNVVLTLLLNPNFNNGESVAGLRELLYRAFLDPLPESDEIALLLRDDEKPNRVVRGHVEKIEKDLFSKDNEMQISLLCADPYIRDEVETVVTSQGPVSSFTYSGTAETGFLMKAEFTTSSDAAYISVDGRTPFVVDYDFIPGDTLIVNSIPGSLSVTVVRAGASTNILYSIKSSARWPFLRRPATSVRVYGTPLSGVPTPNVAVVKEIRYQSSYWGI